MTAAPGKTVSSRLAVFDTTVEVNQFEIHYQQCGEGPPAILLHGLGGSTADWSETMPALAGAYRLYALDLPGFGLSPVPRQTIQYNLAYAASLVLAFADRLGLGRVVLIGNSLGGGISLRFAVDYPARVAGVILANAVGLGREIGSSIRVLSLPGVARLSLSLVTRRMVRDVWESLVVDPAHATEERVERTWAWLRRPGVRQYLAHIYPRAVTLCGQRDLLLDRLPRVQAPTLIVWGQEDSVLPPSHGQRAHELVARSTLHLLPQCAHIPQIEQAGRFNRLCLEWLQAIASDWPARLA
jgi:pimeloyl-ACP methyl ester carboxylesterase